MLLQLFLIIGVAVAAINCNCGPCPAIPRHYEELGCVGNYIEGPCCPDERFDCPDLNSLDTNVCYFKGKIYQKGESISDTDSPVCNKGCICGEGLNGFAEFNCPIYECGEIFHPQETGCVNHYSLDQCCSVKRTCGDEVNDLPKCHFRGKIYSHGQKFIPDVNYIACHNCICDEDFDNSTNIQNNPNCKIIDCGMELHDFSKFKKGCVPIYFKDTRCCPIDFKCPNENDIVLPHEGLPDISSVKENAICKFGSLTMQRSQMIETNDKCVECSCRKPPMIECIKRENCD